MLDEDSMSNILSLVDVACSHRVTMYTQIDDVFYSHASKAIACYGRTKDRMSAVNRCAIDNVTRSEWKSMLDKEGIKGKKKCLTNLITDNLSFLCSYECKRVKTDRKASQALGTRTINDFKVAIRMSLTRYNQATTEDTAFI